jgi:hypothetical protein
MRTTNNIWINPIIAIRLFTKTLLSRSSMPEEDIKIIKDRKLKVTVEAWSAAMYLLALDKDQPNVKHFFQPNPNDPPDFFGLDLFIESNVLLGYVRDIEVFQYVSESSLSLEEEISKKVKKAYSKETVLVCHIRKTFTDTVGHIYDLVNDLKPKNDVWIIGGSEKDHNSPNLVAQVFPVMKAIHVDVAEVIKTDARPAFIQGSMGKNTNMIFEPTGKSLRLTPEFEINEMD